MLRSDGRRDATFQITPLFEQQPKDCIWHGYLSLSTRINENSKWNKYIIKEKQLFYKSRYYYVITFAFEINNKNYLLTRDPVVSMIN